jgi:hypothetical protein
MNTKHEAELAFRAWAELRSGASRNYRLDYSAPQSSGQIDHETALLYWRAEVVEEVIRQRAKSRLYGALLRDLVWHRYGEGRSLDSFRGNPRGCDGTLAGWELAVLAEAVAERLGSGKGRPLSQAEVA